MASDGRVRDTVDAWHDFVRFALADRCKGYVGFHRLGKLVPVRKGDPPNERIGECTALLTPDPVR